MLPTLPKELLDSFSNIFNIGFRVLGWCLSVGLYIILSLHVYAYFTVIAHVIKYRLGTQFGLVWCAIGLILLYNIIFNHFLAMILKPGSPLDL